MNIIVSPFDGDGFYCRPDSTLIRAISEYYIPDYVESLSISPAFVVKTLRAGKAISERFAHRYIDCYGFGALIHAKIDRDFALSTPFIENSLDYTSIVPLHNFPCGEMHSFSFEINYKESFSALLPIDENAVYKKISQISSYCSLRIGDFILFEQASPKEIKEKSHIKAMCDDKILFDFLVEG